MDEWAKAILQYKKELMKEKAKQEKILRATQKRLNKHKIAKGVVLQLLNGEITKLQAIVNECKEQIDTHKTLLEQSESGYLDRQSDHSSD